MEKLVLAAWRDPSDDGVAIGESMTAAAREQAEAGHWTTVAVEDPHAAAMLLPAATDDLVLTSVLTTWVDTVEQAADLAVVDAPRTATYLVTESTVLRHVDRDWPDGTPSPGVSLMVAIARVAGLDDRTFFDRWHGSHAIMTLRVHPVTQYVRNAVVRPLTADAPDVAGFVQDHVATRDDLLDPTRFYGADPGTPWQEGARMVADDVQTFVDLDATHTTPMTETILRSAPWEVGPSRPSPLARTREG